jgi:hypothetical protein
LDSAEERGGFSVQLAAGAAEEDVEGTALRTLTFWCAEKIPFDIHPGRPYSRISAFSAGASLVDSNQTLQVIVRVGLERADYSFDPHKSV